MDNTQVDIWVDAECYYSLNESAQINQATTLDEIFGPEWNLVGLLDGAAGFGNNREVQSATVSAWGKGIVDQTDRDVAVSTSFTSLENNSATRYLKWPGSTKHVIVAPKPVRVKLAQATINQDGNLEIWITRRKARVFAAGDPKSQEVAGVEFQVTVFADARGAIYDVYEAQSDGTLQQLTPISIKDLSTPETPLGPDGTPMTTDPVEGAAAGQSMSISSEDSGEAPASYGVESTPDDDIY
ncbi:hypothetical protein HMPREF0290_0872 [Corynebacterium efficiens YS-314]|uniref:Major tail protein n=1 Tax=Corynebacterium efficiens (strain DSM 44549 / YS-314 / AJ 12310 / JCM 11189 / NBRC 100395) TaxID=196164 RepID=Q8FRB1_COREF|nr:hypothetical protein [Corynebacterium efficiens]EEW50424.1 hypothetical protein HMPREF0290_0872 [Corynebacterium efficiens YS-314]BAC17660.1 hypothetical protein [Corynebacterium efficiens YS-314]